MNVGGYRPYGILHMRHKSLWLFGFGFLLSRKVESLLKICDDFCVASSESFWCSFESRRWAVGFVPWPHPHLCLCHK